MNIYHLQEAIRSLREARLATTNTVQRAQISDMIEGIKKILQSYGVFIGEDAGPPDPLKELSDFMRENKVGFVFWVCPKGCDGQVEWNKEKTDATCQVCGCKKSDNRTNL